MNCRLRAAALGWALFGVFTGCVEQPGGSSVRRLAGAGGADRAGAWAPANPQTSADPVGPIDPSNGESCRTGAPPVLPRVDRLSFEQYDRSIRAWFGLDTTPSVGFGPEIQGISALLWSGLRGAAEAVAEDVSAERLATLVPCRDDNAPCAETIIRTLGRKLYRRPLTDTEVSRYQSLWTDRAELTENDRFDEGVKLLIEAMLSSPHVIARVETSAEPTNGRIVLNGYERATRVAYALWNAPPDDALLAAAARGELDTEAGVRREVERMLTAPEGRALAREMFRGATEAWLGMRGVYAQYWTNTNRNPELFPDFRPGIDASFREEILRFVDSVVFDEAGSFQDLFTSSLTWVNGELAPIYDLSPGDGEWRTVELDPATRPGLLTRAGFNGTHGRFSRGSLIFRGSFVLTRLLCRDLGAPPAGADATQLPTGANLNTTRERVEAMTAGPACAGCHTTLINPAGFSLEAFDGIGKYRTSENGYPVDTSGMLFVDGEGVSFSDAGEFSGAIGASREAHECFVEHFSEYTLGAGIDGSTCEDRAVTARLDAAGSIADALTEFVSRSTFLERNVQELP